MRNTATRALASSSGFPFDQLWTGRRRRVPVLWKERGSRENLQVDHNHRAHRGGGGNGGVTGGPEGPGSEQDGVARAPPSLAKGCGSDVASYVSTIRSSCFRLPFLET